MKIDGASAHSINFIEQKKSNTSTPQKEPLPDRVDTFSAKSLKNEAFLEINESLAMLQISNSSITKLQENNKELQTLNEKFEFFKSQENELNEKFENVTVKMLDIIDNTMFKDKGLFYAKHTIGIGSQEFSFSMLDGGLIEDFTLGNEEKIYDFSVKLDVIKTDIDKIKNHIEITSFNHMAALESNSPLTKLSSDMLSKRQNIPAIEVEDLKQAHDTSLLKDKISYLLD
jgi:hypothetical protein